MNPSKKNTDLLMKWHLLRRKLLTRESFTDTDFKLLNKLFEEAEGRVFPSMRQIQNYQTQFIQFATASDKNKAALSVYADTIIDFEKKFVQPTQKLIREGNL